MLKHPHKKISESLEIHKNYELDVYLLKSVQKQFVVYVIMHVIQKLYIIFMQKFMVCEL